MKQVFDSIPYDNILHLESHIAANLVLALKLLSVDQSQILRDTGNELLNTHKISINSQCNDGYPGNLENVIRSIEKWQIPGDSIVDLKL